MSLHREWYQRSALGDLLGEDLEVVSKDKLYRCLDRLLPIRKTSFHTSRNAGPPCSRPASISCSTT